LEIGKVVSRTIEGRRIAVGDIHGCFNTFESLIEDKIKLQKIDQLFLLGDYIDKGTRNREVLDYIIEMQNDGYQVFPLIGNHEYFVMRDIEFCQKSNNPQGIRDLIESTDLLNEEKIVDSKYHEFILNLPYYYELDDFILVHAGLDFEEKDPLFDKMSMIYARNYLVNRDKINGKILDHGHTPVSLSEIKNLIHNKEIIGRINLDNGCVNKQYTSYEEKDLGRLCALDLDNMKLFTNEYID